jgi:subtilisin family serine protease
MNKTKIMSTSLSSFFASLVILVFVLNGGAVISDNGPMLEDGERVIVRGVALQEKGAARTIRGTDFSVVTVQEARELRRKSPKIELYGLQDYQMLTNDPFEPQSYLNLLKASELWNKTTGSTETVVAIIDSGYALQHEDLIGRWQTNTNEVGPTAQQGPPPNCTSRGLTLDKSCNNIDDDGNGFVDDWQGWDFAYDDNNPSAGAVNPDGAGVGHGTAVAGMVGATGNNGVGVASVNWGARFLPIQVFNDNGGATTAELAEGMAYAIAMGADVINLSLGSTASDPVIESLINNAEAAGIVIVAAAGNCGGTDFAAQGCSFRGQTLFPATNNLTVAVAGTDLSDVRATFSSEGNRVDLAAPATGSIRTTIYDKNDVDGWYSASISGTSFASPIVAGVAALVKDAWPDASPRDVRAVLIDTSLRVAGMNGSIYTQQHGFGRLQPVQAVTRAERCNLATKGEDINCDGFVDLLDLSVLASQWNLQRGGRSDINKTGVTDLLDLSLLANKWGQ